jgi:hypothetical protein
MSSDLVSIIAFGVYTALLAVLLVVLFRMVTKVIKLSNAIKTGMIEKTAMVARIEQLESARDSDTVENTEGFLRFISESRDWAFTYIEDVQQALTAYDVALSTDDAKIINEAYKKLISFVPDDDVLE